jgi:branched-chain amino acid transport system permease protein
MLTMYVFLALTMGGTGNNLGAFMLIFVLEASRFVAPLLPELSAVQHAAIREMIVTVLFIVVLLWRPAGLIPEKRAR